MIVKDRTLSKGLRALGYGLFGLVALGLLLQPSLPGIGGVAQAQITVTDVPMPEFTSKDPKLWVNTKPLMKDNLKGKVLLLEVWTTI